MQNSERISLNAVRIFAVVAEHQSFKLAAQQLGVTAGAVSRQVQSLEVAMGVRLFDRRNNAIWLTEAGETFLRDARPGLQTLNKAIDATLNEGRDLTVLVPTTLATLWLVPLLADFKRRWPDIAVRIDTYDQINAVPSRQSDILISYLPVGMAMEDGGVLLEDRCRPYLSPGLLSSVSDPGNLTQIPALQCTRSNWDWLAWLKEIGAAETQLSYAGQFDLDQTALRAAVAGMGMVLSSEFIVQDDLQAGRLCALPGHQSVLLGHYTIKLSEMATSGARIFARWLRSASQRPLSVDLG